MRSFITILFTFIGLAALVLSAPIGENNTTEQLEKRMKSSRVTWYSGGSLVNPACGGPSPNDNSMIGAVQQGGRFGCGDHLNINYKGRSVRVKVIDYCGDCSSTAIDLTKGAFKKLANLSVGELHGATINYA